MEIASIGPQAAALPQVTALRENEAAERAPDNEAAEAVKAKAPLPQGAGTLIDTQA